MFENSSLRDLMWPEFHPNFLDNPPPAYSLRRSDITLSEFYSLLTTHFQFRACWSAHHLPWVANQNPDNCPLMRTNPGCSHSDEIVAREFHWVWKVAWRLNQILDGTLFCPSDFKKFSDWFFLDYVFFRDSPNLDIFLRDYVLFQENPSLPHVLRPELAAEVERVKAFQFEKSKLFFTFLQFLAHRIQEILLMPNIELFRKKYFF